MKNEKMTNKDYSIIEYVQDKKETFFESAFNEVDSLVFAQFCYLKFTRLVGSPDDNKDWVPISSLFRSEEIDYLVSETCFPDLDKKLITAICSSPRFRDVLINYYVEKNCIQGREHFSAVSFLLPTKDTVIAYRGTDDSLIGWKETLSMIHASPIPSQLSALEYLNFVAANTPSSIYLTGHSKGGNLAVYSASCATLNLKNRILSVYDLDGPGFLPKLLRYDGFRESAHKIVKLSPSGSCIGSIMKSAGKLNYIQSKGRGFLQHSAFNWQINGIQFIRKERNSKSVCYWKKTINTFIYKLTYEQRALLINTLFRILNATKSEGVSTLIPLAFKERDNVLKTLKELGKDTSTAFKEVFNLFLRITVTHALAKQKIK